VASAHRANHYSDVLADLKGREVLVQPFLPGVLSEGELSFFFFNGVLSHAAQKQPKAGDFRVQEEHGGLIAPVPSPSPRDVAVAKSFVDAVAENFFVNTVAAKSLVDPVAAKSALSSPDQKSDQLQPPLYARVDLVRDAGSDLRLMELELIEPSLYLRTHPQAPLNFVRALLNSTSI
jgi:hypothetical protein